MFLNFYTDVKLTGFHGFLLGVPAVRRWKKPVAVTRHGV
jgi:hypothetical protein